MSLTLRIVLRLALSAALLAIPTAGLAQAENPNSLGSPEVSDNPNLDHNDYGGGDAGSPWPVSIRAGHRHGPSTQSGGSAPAPAGSGPAGAALAQTAVIPWLEPVLTLLPGSLPRMLWLPLEGLSAGLARETLPGRRAAAPPD